MSTPTSASAGPDGSASSTSASTVRGERAVVGERFERRVGQRVDRVGTDQLVDVEHVGVVGVLGRVDAHSGRWTRAPRAARASQR